MDEPQAIQFTRRDAQVFIEGDWPEWIEVDVCLLDAALGTYAGRWQDYLDWSVANGSARYVLVAQCSSRPATIWRKMHGRVDVTVDADVPCEHPHGLAIMHHTDEHERHYCPTGFLYCPDCMGLADEPAPYTCTRWGE